ncbi:MAG TPA: TetR/AcrR family transcriptional regulator [Longimicrobiales bacterium]|nr:TetR/AcrR family transcriptional regulator [Longimicrobiales bacterium]
MKVAEPQAEGRRERKKREVELRIRESALALFREQGYAATTVEQIAERADVAKGTVFNYFPRKESLLAIVAEELMAEIYEALGPRDALVTGGEAALRRIYMHCAQEALRDPEFSRTMMSESMRAFWEQQEEGRIAAEFRELLTDVITSAQDRGEFRRSADPYAAGRLLEAAYFATLVEWLKRGGSGRPLAEELDLKFDIIFAGLRSGEAG